jgi:hypothetical protein
LEHDHVEVTFDHVDDVGDLSKTSGVGFTGGWLPRRMRRTIGPIGGGGDTISIAGY